MAERTEAAHVRVDVKRQGHRINDSKGNAGRTLCGASLTARDMLAHHALACTASDIAQFKVCPACLSRLRGDK